MSADGPSTATTTYGPKPDTFKIVAYVEAVSYLVLLAATFNYRVLDGPDLASLFGPIHGTIYLVFLVVTLKIRPDQRWSLGRTLWILVLAALPLGGFFAGRELKEPAEA